MNELHKRIFHGVSKEWQDLLDSSDLIPILKQLSKKKGVVPQIENIFEFARLTDVQNIKVVILGQDPYPTAGDAHGLAFSCLTCIPGALRNIYKCLLKHKHIEEMPTTGNLTYWAEQGVLLLNCSLTAVIGKSNAHRGIWREYTDRLIGDLSNIKSQQGKLKFRKIFMLWGKDAKKKKSLISIRCPVLEWSHPSPNAVAAGYTFETCDHFTKANEMLKDIGKIDWHLSPESTEVEQALGMAPMKCVIFTDGSAYPNKACPESRAGYAAIFSLGQFMDTVIYGNLDVSKHYATNQRAEGMAIYQAMLFLQRHTSEWNSAIFVCDTEFWIKMYEQYMPSWQMKEMDFKEKKNSDMTIPMWELYQTLTQEYGKEIEFRHVRSHNKDGWKSKPIGSYERFVFENNDMVDSFAGYARKKVAPGKIIEERLEIESD